MSKIVGKSSHGSDLHHDGRVIRPVHRSEVTGEVGERKRGETATEFTDRPSPAPPPRASVIMSRSSTNGWLRGTTVRKGGAATNAQRPSQGHVVSTSNTIFGGGVKDPSGRTSEYFVRRARHIQ